MDFKCFPFQNKKITDDGVTFRSHIDGQTLYLDAEKSINIQHDLGADIIMAFDECPPSTADESHILRAVNRTTAWAQRSLESHRKISAENTSTPPPQIFGIIQGGTHSYLREKSRDEITKLPFAGFALGGLAVGEAHDEMYAVVQQFAPTLPHEKPRYLMGVGTPTDLLEAIEGGIDMFDCVLPMRNARHGVIYTWEGMIRITNAQFATDESPLDAATPESPAFPYARGYIHHLLKQGEDLGKRLATLQNLYFYHHLMRTARDQIFRGEFMAWKKELVKKWRLVANC